MDSTVLAYVGFIAFVIFALFIDLKVLHKHAHEVTTKEAAITSAGWIAISLLFAAALFAFGDAIPGVPDDKSNSQVGLEFLTGYLIEKSLSVDNIFVFVLLFSFFNVPAVSQHRVLFYGVVGAIVFRAIFIFAGVALIERFAITVLFFGLFLIYSGFKMFRHDGDPVDPADNKTLKLVRRIIPISDQYDGSKMFSNTGTVGGKQITGRRVATPLFAALVVIEVSDLIFAVDSIPAILAISDDAFIVFTSNIFAILGLRALYFLLAGVVGKFHLLRVGLALTLSYVGVKMSLTYLHEHVDHAFPKIPTVASLLVVAALIGGSIYASLRWPAPEPALPEGTLPADEDEASSSPLH
ncbi:MAG TPA: TerC family protein [Mycobacteriales bacterium]|nr:TerC family protein [Mycobacteriales bacterium]